ncbi:MAG: DNA polymerase III subunit beta [bacterium]|nr:DNA polymerase III subunit beta [bacterium]
MKTQVLKENLKRALSIVERATAKTPTLPVLGCIALVAQKNSLELSATDLELAIRYRVLAKTEQEGGVAVPARLFSQFAALLEEREVRLANGDAGLRVESKDHQTSIKTMPLDDFPIIPTLQGTEEPVEIDAKELCDALSRVVGMAGQNQARPEISGVLAVIGKEEIRLVATDSFRLAEKILNLGKAQGTEASVILPQKTARELAAILGEAEGRAKLYLSPTQILVGYSSKEAGGDSFELVSRLIEGDYPQYQDVIPRDFKAKAVVSRADLVSRVRSASVFSGKMQDVKVVADAKKKGLEISSESSEVGKHSSFLGAEVTGERLEISFNWRFLLEGLSNMRGEEVEIGFAGEDAPAVIRPRGKEQYLYVVMPVKA